MIDLEALSKLEAAASKAPWRAWTGEDTDYGPTLQAPADCSNCEPVLHVVVDPHSDDLPWPTKMSETDAALIAAMRNALPALLREVKAAREWLRKDDKFYEYENVDGTIYGFDEDDFNAVKFDQNNAREAYRKVVEENGG